MERNKSHINAYAGNSTHKYSANDGVNGSQTRYRKPNH